MLQRVERVESAFKAAGESAKDQIEAARSQLTAQSGEMPKPGDQAASGPYIDRLNDRVEQAKAELQTLPVADFMSITADEGARYRALQIAFWRPVDSRDSVGPKYLLDQGCDDKTEIEQRCIAVFAKASEIADSVYLVRNVVVKLHEWLQIELQKDLARRKTRWESYLYDAQFQYWWELAVNRYLEQLCPNGPNAVVGPLLVGEKCEGVKRDSKGNALDWREPPRYRAVLLHPDIGFMYKRDEPKGDRAKPSLVFQWVGYQWWSWNKDNKVSDTRGIALVSTVSDNSTGRVLGFGVQGQYKEYAVAITSHGGKPVFTLSLNLLDKVSKLNDEYVDKLKKP